jgi:hypothetical protein
MLTLLPVCTGSDHTCSRYDPVALTPQSQAHREPFAQDWNNDSKNQQSRLKHHALGSSIFRAPNFPSREDAGRGMAMLPRIFLARSEQIQQSLR